MAPAFRLINSGFQDGAEIYTVIRYGGYTKVKIVALEKFADRVATF